MKFKFLLLSLLSVVLISSPAKAQKTASLSNTDLISPENIQLVNPGNTSFPVGKEMSELNAEVKVLMARYKFLTPGIFFLDLQTGDYLNINGDKVFPAASTIKLPIFVSLFQEIDAGRIKLDETLVMRRQHLAGGSGNMRFSRVGTKFSLLETATRMMTISDNTATNMIIDRLGGKTVLNKQFHTWGLQNTVIRNWLTDVNGTNTTSAKDLVKVSALLTNNNFLSDKSRFQVMDIMRRCQNRRLLPSGLGQGATIAHKTGTLRFVIGDAGIIETPSGRRYLAGILVRRPHHDKRARDFVRLVSQLVYKRLDQPQLTQLSR
jgi:beta-lactamase class A